MHSAVLEKIKEAIREHEIASSEWDSKRKQKDALSATQREKIEHAMKNNCRRADRSDYENWLNGYLQKPDTEISHVYDYGLPNDFYVAVKDFVLPPGYGSYSVNVIVPTGIAVLVECESHNNLYYMNGYNASSSFVPFYKGG